MCFSKKSEVRCQEIGQINRSKSEKRDRQKTKAFFNENDNKQWFILD